MGIENRDYFRDASRNAGGLGGAGSTWPPVCMFILIANIAIFLLQILYTEAPTIETVRESFREFPGDQLPRDDELYAMLEHFPRKSVAQEWLQLDTDKVLGGQVWRVITSAFCHDRFSIFHIIFNMLFLIWFGRILENMYGSREFLLFYLAAALAASVAYMALDLFTGERVPAIGASGAVMGVTMLYAMHFPREKIRLWFFWPIEIRWVVLFYVLYDLHPVLLTLAGETLYDGIAHAAHLGGLAFGFAYRKFEWRLEKIFGNRRKSTGAKPAGPRKKSRFAIRFSKGETPRNEKVVPFDPLSGKIDEILEKISNEGLDSLTPEEKEFLEKSSDRFRDKDP